MTQTLFYLLPPPLAQQSVDLNAVYQLACELAQHAFVKQQHVYIHCENKQQAYAIDELLWQFKPSAFVPHNLKGEGPITGAPVEIGFDPLGPNKNRHQLINLADQVPSFAVNFGQIFDFVANNDTHKAHARDRYRQYRTLGIALATQDIATQPLNLV
ncbi:DNA polymerase III subunit chi [Shewanella surugensis]|uniref:DNA polymerase III subunit chi n=1 Tax=Shewanella surugensis TaxID=212020 RepID=A0ABT0L7X0_9GAMM|nr:DNA polymerase III subunit chi [Shewanella surugensis]MCL1123794.1 DNA polymerase III subunit chi [Shewanella surugensis]